MLCTGPEQHPLGEAHGVQTLMQGLATRLPGSRAALSDGAHSVRTLRALRLVARDIRHWARLEAVVDMLYCLVVLWLWRRESELNWRPPGCESD